MRGREEGGEAEVSGTVSSHSSAKSEATENKTRTTKEQKSDPMMSVVLFGCVVMCVLSLSTSLRQVEWEEPGPANSLTKHLLHTLIAITYRETQKNERREHRHTHTRLHE